MDLFKKCYDFTRADEVKKTGLYPYFRAIEENEGPVVHIEGREVIMAGSNNYLGLTAHPKVKEASIKAIEHYGTGCSGSRYLTGTLELHIELERKMAKFFGVEAVLLYSTGYQTGQGVIPTIVQRGEYVVSDKDNHASIQVAAMMAKGMTADILRYKHNNMNDLERVLKKIPKETPKLIVSDGVFSTGGEIVELDKLVALAKEYNARTLIDDAHAVGVIGKGGRGTPSEFDLVDEVDLTMGTFSKTFASLGGFIAGKAKVVDYIKHHSAALIFSASPTPASAAAAMAALEVLEEEPWRVDKLISNADHMRKGLTDAGFNVIDGRTGIVPLIVGNDNIALQMWRNLFDRGVFVNVFVPPGVPEGRQMMRTSYMATHNDEQLDKIIDTFDKVGKQLGLI
ncbi:MAG: pyridoxal phosphate-dependent aminotransferase family protein [Melioribacteraceae bacterium]|nr:pyridoxal phosphate-dependent aminotransferase family protein [Melioribacteraceae bacterium]